MMTLQPPKLSPQKKSGANHPPASPSPPPLNYKSTPWDIPDESVQLFNKAREIVQQELYTNTKRMMKVVSSAGVNGVSSFKNGAL
jgi:hypothetical protein